MYFADFSCISSVGPTAEVTFAAIEAGASGYREGSYTCKNGKLATMGLMDDELMDTILLSTDYTGSVSTKMISCAKLLYLAVHGLSAHSTGSNGKGESPQFPMIWIDSEPDQRQIIPLEFLTDMLETFSAPVNLQQIQRIQTGRPGGLLALQKAHELMQQGQDYVLIASADVPHETQWLDWLDENERLKNESAPDAFAPGESCALLVLARTPELAQAMDKNGLNSETLVQFGLPGYAASPSHWHNKEAHKGEALSNAINHWLSQQQNQPQPFKALVSSLNGELFWVKEHRVALARHSALINDAELYHPFQNVGDLGAVSGIFMLGYAAHLIQAGQYPRALIYASADKEWRAVAAATGIKVGA